MFPFPFPNLHSFLNHDFKYIVRKLQRKIFFSNYKEYRMEIVDRENDEITSPHAMLSNGKNQRKLVSKLLA